MRRRLQRPWSLRATLLAAVIALFVVVSVAIGAITVVATQRYLIGQTDAELRATAERIEHDGELTTATPPPAAPGRRGHDDRHREGPPDGSSSSLTVIINGDTVTTSRVVSLANRQTTLTSEQIRTLRAAGLSEHPREVEVGEGLGTYRVVQARSPSGTDVIVGVRTGPVDASVRAVARIVAVGVFLGTALVAALGSMILRRSLAPLQRVADTAARVSDLKLDSGAIDLGMRVPERDTNPDTEVGAVGLALNNMLDNVEGALQARQASETRIRQFVADASHELRTPLASIRGYAELSRRETAPVPPPVRHALDRVESESIRMQGLVEDLLLLARLDSGRPLERERTDLSALVVNAVSDAHVAAPDHEWVLDLADEPVQVVGDAARLHQIVANLLTNAGTHTPAGTRVRTSLDRVGEYAVLTVVDNGPGVPAELADRVFERFTRGDASRNRAVGSTGLGLSIVQAVARAHGGGVTLESRPGHTVCTVRIPLRLDRPPGRPGP